MNTNAKLWVEALRSGKYKQGGNHLVSKIDGSICHCVLGVGQDLHIRSVGKGIRAFGSMITHQTKEWLGMKKCSPSVNIEFNDGEIDLAKNTYALYELNDVYRLTFDQIADIIENNQESIFVKEGEA